MSTDIFQFWSEISEDAYIHPEDQRVFQRVKHVFAPNCLPGPYCGGLRSAPVVLLFLSLGLDANDPIHSASDLGRQYYATQRAGTSVLPDSKDHEPAFKWFNRIFRQFDVPYEQARSKVATFNIGAYKSKAFTDWPMLAALPSSRVALDWAQSVLFPQAERGERIVVCLRSPRYWGLETGLSSGSLFCPPCNRNAIMRLGDMRNQITKVVQAAVLDS